MTRRGGGQKGNKNAIKHGMYARYYDEEFKTLVVKWPYDNFIDLIQLQRNSLVRAAERIQKSDLDTPGIVALINAIAVQVTAITSAVARHSLMNEPDHPVLVAWNDVSHEQEFFFDGEPPV